MISKATKDKQNKQSTHTKNLEKTKPTRHVKIIKPSSKSDNKIKTYLRIKPILQQTIESNYQIKDNDLLLESSEGKICFKFPQKIEINQTQSSLFETIVLPMISDFLEQKNAFFFCFGPQNSGKTYTLFGNDENSGIIQMTLNHIFNKISNEKRKPRLSISLMEINNETIFDLLCTKQKSSSIRIGIDKDGEIEIKNLVELPLNTINDINNFTSKYKGDKQRKSSSTVIRLKLSIRNKLSYFVFVDLPATEKSVRKTSNVNTLIRDSDKPNTSLQMFLKCVKFFQEFDQRKATIPYKDSKLTHLLKQLFEPGKKSSKSSLILNISLDDSQIQESLYSLQLASETSLITHQLHQETKEDIENRVQNNIQKEMNEFMNKSKKLFEQQIQSINETIKNLNINNYELINDNKNCDLSIDELNEILEKHNKENCEIENENKKLKEKIDLLNNKINSTEEENKRLEEENEKLQNRIKELKKTNENLKKSLNNTKNIEIPLDVQCMKTETPKRTIKNNENDSNNFPAPMRINVH